MKAFFLMILLLGLTYSIGQWLKQQKKSDSADAQVIYIENSSVCSPAVQACRVENKNNIYELSFSQSPSALSPFSVKIKIKTNQPEAIEIYFEMNGMDMGFSMYQLDYNEFIWQKAVILPVCSLGRNDWLLNVKMKFKNEIHLTKFKFSQAKK